jgi:hypothetical protein
LKGGHAVRKQEHSDEQIAFALKQAQLGTPVEEVRRKMGVPDATFYNWRKEVWRAGARRSAAAEAAESAVVVPI